MSYELKKMTFAPANLAGEERRDANFSENDRFKNRKLGQARNFRYPTITCGGAGTAVLNPTMVVG